MTDSTPHDGFTSTDAARAADTETSASDAHRSRAYDSDAHDSDAHASYDAPRRASGSASDAETTASSVPAAAHANAASRPHDRNDVGDGPQYGVGPFSLREVVLLGIWVVAFFVSFFRTNILDAPSGVLVGGANVWLSGLWWIPAVALPTVAVGLLALRRLSPQGIRRVGSLGIDQFASVAFTVAALVWVSWVWDTVAVFTSTGVWTRSWVMWVEAVVLLAGVVLTVFAPLIPPFSADFRGRDDVPAHRNARPIRPVVSRPRAPRTPRPVAAASTGVEADAETPTPGSYTGSTDLAHEPAPATSVLPAHTDDHETDVFAPLRADFDAARHDEAHDERSPHENADDVRDRADAEARGDHARWAASSPREGVAEQHADDHPHAQAFWALAPEEREIVDDYGTPIFHIGPTAWALVIEDRGETFVVRHDDGRIGYLHDVSGVTRG